MGLAMLPMVLSGALGAASSIYQGKAAAAGYEAQARVAENNQRLAEMQASESLQEGARDERRFHRQARQFQSGQESQLAASGATLSGSALSVMQDTAQGIEEDAATIRFNTLKQKWGFDVQAQNYGYEAAAARSSAKNAKTAGYIGAATSILGTAVNIWGAQPVNQPVNATASGKSISVSQPQPNNYNARWGYRGMGTAAPAYDRYKTGWWK